MLTRLRQQLACQPKLPTMLSTQYVKQTATAAATNARTLAANCCSKPISWRGQRKLTRDWCALEPVLTWLLVAETAPPNYDPQDDKGSQEPGPVIQALKNNSLGFGFSAGGLLYPYYIGVVQGLDELGIITGI